MRIQSIEIENITSLRGKHQINLAESLQGEELFAITGPTGSGKSSLLSAISLALYGRTYKGSLSANDFVTTGEAYAMASIKFILAGKNYQANWSIKTLKKNGEPIKSPKPSRELICEGVALEHASASLILGLDFDQFCKTIILNQGQFAQFLHSSFKDRKDIIEKLYRTGELSDLGKILKEKVKKEEHQLELNQAHYEKALPYSELEINNIKKELLEKQDLLKIHEDLASLFNPAFTDLNHLYQKLKEEDEYQKKIKISKSNLEKYTNNWNESKKTQLSFKKAFETATAKSKKDSPMLREAIKHKTNFDNSEKLLLKTTSEIAITKAKKADFEESIEEKNNQTKHFAKKIEVLRESYTNKKLFTAKTKNEIYSFKEDLIKLKLYSEEIQKNRTEHGLYSTQAERQLKELNLKSKDLTLSNIDKIDLKGESSEALAELRRKREAGLELMNHLERDSSELTKLFIKNTQLEKQNRETKGPFELKSAQLENLVLKIENERLNSAINECALEAQKNGECPVCENNELSALKNHSLPQKVSREELKDLEDQVAKMGFQRESDLKQINLNKNEITSKVERINKITINLFDELNKPIKWQTSSEVEQGLKILKEMNQSKLQANLKKQESLSQLFAFQKEINNLDKALNENIQKVKVLDTDLEKTNNLVNLFLNNWKEILPGSKTPSSIIKEFEKDLEIFNEYIQADQKLASLLESLETDSSRALELTSKLNADQKIKIDLEVLIDDLKIKLDLIGVGKNPIELLELLEKNERATASDFQKANDELSKVEKLKTSEEQTLRIYLEQIGDLQNLQKTYIKKLKTIFKELVQYSQKIPNNYPLFETCQDVFKSSAKWIDLPEGITSSDLLPIVESRLESTWKDLNEKMTDISLDLKTSVQSNTSRVVEYNKKLEGRKELEDSLKSLKKSLHLKQRLLEVFGKDEFRSYALGLLEEELVLGANQELDELCDGRYHLKLLAGRGGQMEFFVSDQWRESTLRKIDTLSGGETFLASLAMALALAELTRGQNEIDSFFIDEGFGHLDGDSIEEVLEVLMNIQNRGKQIGIISHVKALTDRIPVNLTLQKTSLGESTTEFIYN